MFSVERDSWGFFKNRYFGATMQAVDQNINRRAEAFAYELERSLQNAESELIYGEEGTCNLCSKTFARRSSLLTHIRNHSAERKFICSYCQKGFTQAANLRNHERIHTNVRPYVCIDCGKAFTQITNLNNHRRLHTGERPFVCIESDCGRSFAQVTNLNNHMKSHHKIQQYVCNQCPRRFTQVTSLNQHLLVHAGFSGFYCTQCPEKVFKTHVHLQQHVKTHGINFPYECTKCEEKFQQQAHLTHHMHVHDDFKFRCTICDSSFNQEGLLKKHVQRHLDGRYLTCPIPGCEKGFTIKHHLTKHLQTAHSNNDAPRRAAAKRSLDTCSIGKHNCYFDTCDAYFYTSDELNEHLSNTHGLSMAQDTKKRGKMESMFAEQLKYQIALSNNYYLGMLLDTDCVKTEPVTEPDGIRNGNGNGNGNSNSNANDSNGSRNVGNTGTDSVGRRNNVENISKDDHQSNGNGSKDERLKCVECNVFYNNERDLRVHTFYKHPHLLQKTTQ